MTDNEIVKALECCRSESGNDCDNCPYSEVVYRQGEGGCTNRLMEDALDLINHQKAEIEKLRNIVKTDLLNAKSDFKLSLSDISEIRAEAIKEFAKRLKAISHPYADTQMVFELQIDNLVKEMVGDSDANTAC